MKSTTLNLKGLTCAAFLLLLLGAQLNCSYRAPAPALPQATTQSAPVCYDDGIGCGTPKLGGVHIGQLFSALPVQTTALMYADAQQAGLQVDRIGTYWDWFMDQNGNYNPASPYLQELDTQIAGDFNNGVTPEFLLGTEAPNNMPAGSEQFTDLELLSQPRGGVQCSRGHLGQSGGSFPNGKVLGAFQ